MSATPEREACIFNAARKLPIGERAFYLDGACGGDAPLRQRVEELLQANDAAGAFLPELATAAEGAPLAVAAREAAATIRAAPSPSEQPGDSIDRYKLLEKIGEDGFDRIVLKVLAKDRTRRYETANGLMVDIQRHLKNESVVARPPSNLYRFQKMVRALRMMTLNDIRRFNGLVGPVIAAVICVVSCSRNPGADAAEKAVVTKPRQEEAKLSLLSERLMVPVTNGWSTQGRFIRHSPPPWLGGNFLTFYFRKSAAPAQEEEWAFWNVVNMHAENFSEITSRLGIDAVEVRVFHARRSPVRIEPVGALERTAIRDEGYALITDTRIPQQWLLKEPGRHLDKKTGREIRAAYPGSFRASE